jgi:hypothetical protein
MKLPLLVIGQIDKEYVRPRQSWFDWEMSGEQG